MLNYNTYTYKAIFKLTDWIICGQITINKLTDCYENPEYEKFRATIFFRIVSLLSVLRVLINLIN